MRHKRTGQNAPRIHQHSLEMPQTLAIIHWARIDGDEGDNDDDDDDCDDLKEHSQVAKAFDVRTRH